MFKIFKGGKLKKTARSGLLAYYYYPGQARGV
jgi:hypothetical protein